MSEERHVAWVRERRHVARERPRGCAHPATIKVGSLSVRPDEIGRSFGHVLVLQHGRTNGGCVQVTHDAERICKGSVLFFGAWLLVKRPKAASSASRTEHRRSDRSAFPESTGSI